MKKESGITLITLIIYVIGITIITGILTVITNFFYQNVMHMEDASSSSAEYSKFNVVFIEEVKSFGNKVIEPTELNVETKSISFSSGNTYTFQDNKIYKNKIAIASDISDCKFKLRMYESKQIVSVYMKIGGKNGFEQTIEYVVSYKEDNRN